MKIKFTKDVNEHKQGTIIDIDSTNANKLISEGYASVAPKCWQVKDLFISTLSDDKTRAVYSIDKLSLSCLVLNNVTAKNQQNILVNSFDEKQVSFYVRSNNGIEMKNKKICSFEKYFSDYMKKNKLNKTSFITLDEIANLQSTLTTKQNNEENIK